MCVVRPTSRFEASELRATVLAKERRAERPWWRRGGMHFTEAGAIFTFIVPTLIISLSVFENRPQLLKAWLALLVVILTAGRTPNRPLIPYVNFIFPSYLWFMTTGLLLPNPLIAFGCMYVFFAAKVGICMSVCFHRYAAHQAFKCGSLMRGLICTLGCLANQGGPIWWASNHRCHHRYCDQERDPHSAVLDGDTRAFAFFVANEYKWVVEDFAPRHIDTLVVRMIDTFAIVPVIGEVSQSHPAVHEAPLSRPHATRHATVAERAECATARQPPWSARPPCSPAPFAFATVWGALGCAYRRLQPELPYPPCAPSPLCILYFPSASSFCSFAMWQLLLGYWMGGMTGLWIAAVSAQQSQALSLWFNIVNHPDHKHEDDAAAEKAGKFGGANAVCVAADKYMFKDTPNVPPLAPASPPRPHLPFHLPLPHTSCLTSPWSSSDPHCLLCASHALMLGASPPQTPIPDPHPRSAPQIRIPDPPHPHFRSPPLLSIPTSDPHPRSPPSPPQILFSFLNLNLFIAALAGEDGHGHHHQYAQLAQRPGLDLPYRLFVYPLRRFGLIYDAKLLSDIAPAGLWAQKSAEKASEKPLPSTEVASG